MLKNKKMIRKLEKRDIPLCVEICKENFERLGYSYETRNEFLAQFKKNTIGIEFYVFEENRILKGVGGLANCWFDSEIYGLCTCFIKPEYQNQGIGKAITEYRINRVKELGGKVIFSTTQQVWHLERFGFKVLIPDKKWNVMQLIIP